MGNNDPTINVIDTANMNFMQIDFWTAVKLLVDLGVQWVPDSRDEGLEAHPQIATSVYPHRDIFDQDFSYITELGVKEKKIRDMQQRKTALQRKCELETLSRFNQAAVDPNSFFRKLEEDVEHLTTERQKKAAEQDKGALATAARNKKRANEFTFDCFKEKITEEEAEARRKRKEQEDADVLKLPIWLQFFDGHAKAIYRP